jgi:hypothetical protein
MLANAIGLIPHIRFVARTRAHDVQRFQINVVISNTDWCFIAVKSDSPKPSTKQNCVCESHLEGVNYGFGNRTDHYQELEE